MEELLERCAGLDVHRDTVVATVRSPKPTGAGRAVVTRTISTTTAGLTALGGWLAGERVDKLVGMESTGVYWKPVFFMHKKAGEGRQAGPRPHGRAWCSARGH